MGIQGLLPFLKSIHRPSHLHDWAGHTLAIDGYVWLHRAAYACAQELCLGQPTNRHVDYFMQKIALLSHHGVSAYVVFDGDHLPSKRLTEQDRASRRAAALARANRLLTLGDRDGARDEFVKAADITPQIAYDVILALRAANVKYVVAPYEADAQLRYLEMSGQVSGIITEDSDLLVYGARNVLFKLDGNGHCVHISRDDFELLDDRRMALWTDGMFRQMAMLSGCDYLASIPGLGIKRAHELIRRFTNAERAIRATRLEGKLSVPPKYEQRFREAELTFLHQFVYDPTTRSLVPLHPFPSPPPSLESLAGCGERWEDEIAIGVAEGRLDPLTKAPFCARQPVPDQPNGSKLSCPAPKRASQKHGQVRLSENQPTLGQFAFKVSSSSSSRPPSSTPNRPSTVLRPLTTTNLPQPPHSPNTSSTQPSKFFGRPPDAPACCSSSARKPSLLDRDAFEELVAEDVEPLSQESWDAVSEVPSEGGSESGTGGATEASMGEDLPSSQMHAPRLLTARPCDEPECASPISSPETVRRAQPAPSVVVWEPPARPARGTSSDGVISSEPEESEAGALGALVTPQLAATGRTLKRRVSEPVPRRGPGGGSSDPIVSSGEEGQGVGAWRRGAATERRAVKKGRRAQMKQKVDKDEEEMSPSLARVASGIRSRFMYRRPAVKVVGQQGRVGRSDRERAWWTAGSSVVDGEVEARESETAGLKGGEMWAGERKEVPLGERAGGKGGSSRPTSSKLTEYLYKGSG